MNFEDIFQIMTGHPPFPWQVRLYKKFSEGEFPNSADIPTGLGKTSVVVIWLIALALHPKKVPRRLVYVVNRRTVVDQTTTEIEKLRDALIQKSDLKIIADKLLSLCALPLPTPKSSAVAISTLRGQFADNREWSADPARPAVIIGTVDMIGSGLLFSRYTVGFKLRPHHAAFLAQDSLVIHDEAHLEPAFQQLLESIVAEQTSCNDPRKLKVMELTATTRTNTSSEAFRISKEDEDSEVIDKRINAVKKLSLIQLSEKEKEQDKIIELAIAQKDSGRAILVFVRLVTDATKIAAELEKKLGKDKKDKVCTLTGTMRGKERDELIKEPTFRRFLQKDATELSVEGTVFLVATSAGEVGVNISADDLICDLSAYESMAQRFGRINRFGELNDSTITVVCPNEFPHTKKIQEAEKAVAKKEKGAEKKLQEALDKAAYDVAREKTMSLLMRLDDSASPASLESLPHHDRLAAFSPPPKMRQATSIQFDAWALTSIRKPIAARPPVAPYLHGEAEWQPPETHLVWREELDIIHDDLLAAYPPEDMLEDFPLKPHELLRDTSKRIAETLSKIIENYLQSQQDEHDLRPAWLVREGGSIRILDLLPQANLLDAYKKSGKVRDKKEKEEIKRHKEFLTTTIENATLILPASLGGMSSQGLFSADAKKMDGDTDVSGIKNIRLRIRTASADIPDEYASEFRLIRAIDTHYGENDNDGESPTRYWLWLESEKTVNGEKRTSAQPETLMAHAKAVTANAVAIAQKLFPKNSAADEPRWHRCLPFAAGKHDDGKNRLRWQQGIGNTIYDQKDPNTIYAKSGGAMRPRNLAEDYRHEFGSLSAISTAIKNPQGVDLLAEFTDLERDVILHLIAAHHGRARPHFPENEIFDYSVTTDDLVDLATEVPRRFARLQQRFGRWGLAWLESILRSADYAASAGIIADRTTYPVFSRQTLSQGGRGEKPFENNPISLRVDITNPGQFFACCGLFELTARLTPGVQGHFEQDENRQWWFVLSETAYPLSTILKKIVEAEITAIEPDDTAKTAITINTPFNILIDWWRYEGGAIGKLKTWAGNMSVCSVANNMKQILKKELSRNTTYIENILFLSSSEAENQPYYFDANYAVNAQAQDVGFSKNNLKDGGFKINTTIMPAVEFLCLVGVQRARPLLGLNEKGKERLYDYRVWSTPLSISLIPAAIAGVVPAQYQHLRFANPSRARDYRAFIPAITL